MINLPDIAYDDTPQDDPVPARPVLAVELPDTDDLVELARAAIPALVRRAVALAHGSESLPAVTAVLSMLADRAYGKPTQGIEHSGTLTLAALVEQSLALSGPQEALEGVVVGDGGSGGSEG